MRTSDHKGKTGSVSPGEGERRGAVTATDRPVAIELVYSAFVRVLLRFDRDRAAIHIV